jgi:anaerobic magnesium-protoporphyrin IX monomethyl ester cyclase
MKSQVDKCLLIYRGPQKESKDYFTDFVPIGLFNILYSLLKEGFDAKLINFSRYKTEDIIHFFKNNNYNVVFISTFFGNHYESFKIARLAKKYAPKSITILGGPFSILGKEILKKIPEIDFVIKGEGEEASIKLLKAIKGNETFEHINNLVYRSKDKLVENTVRFIENIDDYFFLPSMIMPYCSNIKPENFAILISSRGCPFKCSFCSSPKIWQRKIRMHSINLLIDYVKDLRKNFGSLYFSIRDDNFLVNQKRVLNFAESLSKENLYFLWNTQGSAKYINDELAFCLSNAGCDQIQMGIESGSKKILHFLNKHIDLIDVLKAIKTLRNNLIRPFGYFICGMKESMEDTKRTLNFIRKSGLIDAVLSPLVIYPGTALSKNYPINEFFKDREIIYYDKKSYEKYKELYLFLFEEIYHKGYSDEEIKKNNVYNYKNNIVKYYHYSTKNENKALRYLKEIIRKEPNNPWPYFLLGEHFYFKNKKMALKHLSMADKLLGSKNPDIRNKLQKLK